jgi:hypothetical protein
MLAVQPSQINVRLNSAARALRLSALAQALSRVHQNLECPELDLEKVGQFTAGVKALIRLDEDLTTTVEDHDRWQAVDLELRRIEANMGQDLVELEVSWPDLRVMVEPLCADKAPKWASSLRQHGEDLSKAIAAKNSPRISQFFRSYLRQAGHGFYRVDADLKGLCEDLRRVGEPLSLVMRMTA